MGTVPLSKKARSLVASTAKGATKPLTGADLMLPTKGYKVAVGYTDNKGTWHACATETVKATRESQEMAFQFDIDDTEAARQEKRDYEVRVFMPFGHTAVPLQKMEIRLNKLGWG